MITKERLEELIEKGATIYVICWGRVKELNLNDVEYMEEENGDIYYEIADEPRTTDLSHLFETKEDAEEYAEFGNITRTERLELPSWSDVEKDFERLENGTYTIANYKYLISLNLRIDKPAISEILLITETDNYNWNLSRDNYNKARRLCVKLFKGEEL